MRSGPRGCRPKSFRSILSPAPISMRCARGRSASRLSAVSSTPSISWKTATFFTTGSHRVFQNSDVTAFFLDVLPRLKPGILVHIHDIFCPGTIRRNGKPGFILEANCACCDVARRGARVRRRVSEPLREHRYEIEHHASQSCSKRRLASQNILSAISTRVVPRLARSGSRPGDNVLDYD